MLPPCHAVMSCHRDGQKHNHVFNFTATMAQNVRIVQIKSKSDNCNLRLGSSPNIKLSSSVKSHLLENLKVGMSPTADQIPGEEESLLKIICSYIL